MVIHIPSLINCRARASERRNVEWGIWSRQPSEMGCCFKVSAGRQHAPDRHLKTATHLGGLP